MNHLSVHWTKKIITLLHKVKCKQLIRFPFSISRAPCMRRVLDNYCLVFIYLKLRCEFIECPFEGNKMISKEFPSLKHGVMCYVYVFILCSLWLFEFCLVFFSALTRFCVLEYFRELDHQWICSLTIILK